MKPPGYDSCCYCYNTWVSVCISSLTACLSFFTVVLWASLLGGERNEIMLCFWSSINLFFDFLADGLECFIDIDITLGWGLEELNPESVCQRFAFIKCDLSFRLHVALISNEQLGYILACLSTNLFHPDFYVIEGILIINGVCHDDAHCAFVIVLRDLSKPFLASSIPDLQFDFLAINIDLFSLEVYAWFEFKQKYIIIFKLAMNSRVIF